MTSRGRGGGRVWQARDTATTEENEPDNDPWATWLDKGKGKGKEPAAAAEAQPPGDLQDHESWPTASWHGSWEDEAWQGEEGWGDEAWHEDAWGGDESWLYHHYGGPRYHASSTGWDDAAWDAASSGNGWLSDAQLRRFNTAPLGRMTATSDGKWLGSFHPVGDPGGVEWDGRPSPPDQFKDMKPTERVKVPSFDGGICDETNPEAIGKSARSYIRRVQAWLRVTKLPPAHQALALYDALTDKAWVVAEELDLDVLSTSHGVPYFLEWVQTRFMDVEVTKISQLMTDLFRRCKRKPEQSVREFNVEFERMVLRLHEVRCELPPLVKAWLYVDKLRLSEAEELSLLASVGNEYDVRKLQHAALVQDRTLRHARTAPAAADGYKQKPRWKHSVHMTMDGASSDDEDAQGAESETSVLVDEETAQAEHIAYMTYQGAKAKYKESLRGRGTDPAELKRRSEERLRLAKQRSYCSACKRRGHWHKDPECPLKGQRPSSSAAPSDGSGHVHQAQVCHTVQSCYMTAFEETSIPELPEGGLQDKSYALAIVDTACTKSVAGYHWFEEFIEQAEARNHAVKIVDEIEHFKFGASRVHRSTFAVWVWFGIAHHWVAVKVAIVQCRVPLLLSRPALAGLGTTFDIEAQQLSMARLGVQGLPLEQSDTGHPALAVTHFPQGSPPDLAACSAGEIWIPVSQVYMSTAATTDRGVEEASFQSKFYPKKVPREIENMLKASPLAPTSFYSWWKGANQSRDFWIETPFEMIRIHVSPRRFGFNPWLWKTSNNDLKQALLHCLAGPRISECVPVLEEGVHVAVHEHSLGGTSVTFDEREFQPLSPWIGRSRFLKLNSHCPDVGFSVPTNATSGQHLDFAMEDAQGRDHQGTGNSSRPDGQPEMAAARGPSIAHRGPEGEERTVRGGGPHEGHHTAILGRAHGGSQEVRHSAPFQADEGVAHPPTEGGSLHASGHGGPVRQVQGMALPGAPSWLSSLGCGGGEGEAGGGPPGPGALGSLVQDRARAEDRFQSGDPQPGQGSRGTGVCASADARGTIRGPELGVDMVQDLSGQAGGQKLPSSEACDKAGGHGDRFDAGTGGGGPRRGDPGPGGAPRCFAGEALQPRVSGPDGSDYEGTDDEGGLVFLCDYIHDDDGNEYKAVPEDDDTVTTLRTENINDGHAYLLEDDGGDLIKPEQAPKNVCMTQLSPREKAKAGIRQRKRMSEGTGKKLRRQMNALAMAFMACTCAMGSWAQELAADPVNDLYNVFCSSQVIYEAAYQTAPEEVQCLELFAGQARVSEAFARRKRGVLQPRDLRLGHDFRLEEHRQEALQDITWHKPGLVWLAPPCTHWCGFSHLNHSKQELRRLRKKEQVLVEFVDQVFEAQQADGRLVVVENPRGSDLWRHPLLQRWITSQGSRIAKVDLCSYGLTSPDTGLPLKKPLSLLNNSETFTEHVSRLCAHQAGDHQPIQGRLTGGTAVYPTSFAKAVVRAFDAHQRRGRQSLHSAFTTSSGREPQEEQPVHEDAFGAEAISFKGKVNPTVAAALRRVHQNLGHPCNRDLVKHLRLGGAHQSVIQAAQQMTCRTCERSSRAKLHKVSAPATMLDFNEAVAADILWVDTVETTNNPCLNLVDLASTYQAVIPIANTTSEEVARAFVSGWVSWAGAPKHLLVDLDSAFKDNFLTMLDQRCIVVRAAAGQAHWQNSVAERHGASWKLVWAKLVEQRTVIEAEISEAAAAVNDVKNNLRNRSGYSPRQWIFGSSLRSSPDLFDGDEEVAALHAASADSKFARAQVIRTGAKAAFFQCQSKEALARAAAHKPRVAGRDFEPGELVYLYRETKQGKSKKPTANWTGPAVVIGREGSNYWLARGGRCLLAAPEHVREARHEEISEMLRLKMAMKEVRQMAQSPEGEIYEEIDDDDAPGPEELRPQDMAGRADMEADHELEGGQPAPSSAAMHRAATREEMIRTSVRRTKLLDDVPVSIKKARLGEGASASASSAFMAKHCLSAKGKEKQLEKELPWGMIPPDERPLYLEAEDKQWQEHVSFGAVKPLSMEESKAVEARVDPSRILRARFAYKDKNHSKRKTDPSLPCKPKARLCIAGHHDPDLGVKTWQLMRPLPADTASC